VVPAGQYDRRQDPATGRQVVVAGTYHHVEPRPVGAFEALVDIPAGLRDAASVIFLVFLVGGAFTVVDETGALRQAVGWLVRRLQRREAFVIPIVSLTFALGGALENMSEEIIALVPVLLLVTRRLGFDALTAVAISVGAAAVGASFSPINPFQVQIAQKLAGLPLLSGSAFRIAALAIAMAVWIWATWRHAMRTRREPEPEEAPAAGRPVERQTLDARRATVLVLVLATFAIFVYGVMRLGWDFDQMSALFFAMGVLAGLVGGLGFGGTAAGFVTGFTSMAYAAMIIGFARAIFIVLDQGRIIDTLVNALVTPLQSLPVMLSALGMMLVHAAVHGPVPSVSGQAVLTMPVLVPMSDLIGLSRQVVVLAYQYGAGLTELITPTNGTLMAVTAATGVKYGEWLEFAVPVYGALLGVGAAAIIVAILIRL
ncbi:MAG: Na+/H+ antiporter NhaC family protein, partial [Acidobacteriota bacterium]